MKKLPAKSAASRAFERYDKDTPAFVIGAEGSNTINVGVTLKDAQGKAIAERVHGRAYLSDVATGADITGTATTSALAIGTNGKILNITVTGKAFEFVTDDQGRFDVNIIQTAAPVTYYLVIQMPDGSIKVSGAITFA